MKLCYNQANEALQWSSLKNRSLQKCFSFFELLIFSLCFSIATFAQEAPTIQWQKSLGGSNYDNANSIQQTTDGGFIVAGSSNSNDGDVSGNSIGADEWIVKLDANGNIVWQKCLGGSYADVAFSIQQTTDGGFIVAGYSRSNDGDVLGHHGSTINEDYWIVKLDANGNIVWQKCLGGSNDDIAYSIQQTTDGGFIVAGTSNSSDGDVSENHGNDDYWVVKLDENGNIVWQKSLGGSYDDEAFSIQQTNDGGFIVAGGSGSNDGDVSGNHGNDDYWVVKLDENGNIVWQKSLGGSDYDEAFSIQQTNDGGFIVAGGSDSNDGDVSGNHGGYYHYYYPLDYWVVKLDATGNIVWQKCLGGSSVDEASSIQQTSDGGFIVAGTSFSNDGDVSGNHGESEDYWVVKLDANGNIVWQKSLGGSSVDEAYSIQQTADGGFVVAGNSTSNDGDVSGYHGDEDYWIAKLDAGGNIVWQKSLGGSGDDAAYSIQQTTDGGFIVAGISKSNDGDVSGNHGGTDYWVVKLSSIATGYNTIAQKQMVLQLYPNPSSGSFNINLQTGETTTHSATIQILNALGQTIYTKDGMIENGVLQKEIQLNDVPSGMYLVKVTSSDRVYTSQINLQK